MNCELAQERMVAAAYGELADEQMHELDRHLRGFEECRVEREAVWSLKSVADAYPVQEPDANRWRAAGCGWPRRSTRFRRNLGTSV